MDSFYTLDANDSISATGGWWDQFALANDGADAMSHRVMGQSLWGFVADKETRSYLGSIFDNCRDTLQSACLPYRCDSPTRPRLFQMVVNPQPSGGLVVRHKFVNRFVPVVASSSVTGTQAANDSYCPICFSVMVGDLRIDPANMSGAKDPHEGVAFCPNCREDVALAGE